MWDYRALNKGDKPLFVPEEHHQVPEGRGRTISVAQPEPTTRLWISLFVANLPRPCMTSQTFHYVCPIARFSLGEIVPSEGSTPQVFWLD